MEEQTTKIKKIITTIDDDKSYSIDVDETTTFHEFKKILVAAAHLLKNGFRLYHQQQEYTNDYDDNTIQELFPDLDPIPLRIIQNKDVNEFEDELISVRFNINVPCEIHVGKYKMLYCFSCNKSICMDCFSADHRNHKVEEKADYLAPAQYLMNNIFSNSNIFRADARLSKYMDCVNFRSNLKLNIFDNLRKMINELELKFSSCLEYFSTSEDETEKNTNENLDLMKKYCIECFIKLKNDINTKGIIIDDEIFLTLYRKLKEIEQYKTEYFEENKQKYEKLNTLLAPFVQQIESISQELKVTFDSLLNKEIYEKFKNMIQENIVEKVQKETINDFMFKNLEVPRKSLNRMSLGNLSAYKKKGNTVISPSKLLKKEERSPFPRANLSAERKENNSGTILGQNVFSNSKNQQMNKNSSLTWNKTEEQNARSKGFSFEKNELSMKDIARTNALNNRIVTTTTTTTTNINTGNVPTNNISNFSNQFRQTNESVYPGQTKIYSTQSDYTISNMNNLNSINNMNNLGNMISSTQPQVSHNIITKEITQTHTTNTNNSNSNLFNGNLLEVLNSAIEEKELEYQTNKDHSKISETGGAIFTNTNNTLNTVTSSIQTNTLIQGAKPKGDFIIMYPIYNTNYVLGALEDDNSEKFEVDFERTFGEKDLPLRAFPQGAAFCNFEKYLYITGGQEKQKGIGKLFLRVTINRQKEIKGRMAKMPSMLYSHWNHSMIYNENYIFVIGGYNSNKCEAFNIRNMKWESLPDMNCAECQQPILTIHGDYLYAFMGYNKFNILDSVERINLKTLSKWENVIVNYGENVNRRFYGAGVYYVKENLFFIGGKIGFGNEDSDYKTEIYCFKFDNNEMINTDISYTGHLLFIENLFHKISNETVGNFVNVDNGVLATMPIASILQATE